MKWYSKTLLPALLSSHREYPRLALKHFLLAALNGDCAKTGQSKPSNQGDRIVQIVLIVQKVYHLHRLEHYQGQSDYTIREKSSPQFKKALSLLHQPFVK